MKGFTSGETPIRLKEGLEGRLITSISRTGRVIYQDDFESYTSVVTEKWLQEAGTIALDTAYPAKGKAAMKLTTGAVAGNTAQAGKYFGLLGKGRFGVEFWWMTTAALANLRNLYLSVLYYDGVYNNYAQLAYLGTVTSALQKWQYRNSVGTMTDISGGGQVFDLSSTFRVWHHVKGIFDIDNLKYVKLISDEKTFDLSALAIQAAADVTTQKMEVAIKTETETANAISIYVDDLIITDSEP